MDFVGNASRTSSETYAPTINSRKFVIRSATGDWKSKTAFMSQEATVILLDSY